MSISIKVKELKKIIEELLNDGIEYVDIDILDAEEFDGKTIPASLSFDAYDGSGGGIGYEGIEEVKISATYKID